MAVLEILIEPSMQHGSTIQTAIVLAGGLGTRLASLALNVPKPMIDVAGRPFIEHILDFLLGAGVNRAILAVSHKRDVIQTHFGGRYRNAAIEYSIEDEPLGTGGAIRRCFETFALDRAIIVNGDTLFRIDIPALCRQHIARDSRVTIALRWVQDASRFGVVECDSDGIVVSFRTTGTAAGGLINGGTYVLDRRAFESCTLEQKFSFERDFLENNVLGLKPLGIATDAYFIDIGIPEDLERARRDLSSTAN